MPEIRQLPPAVINKIAAGEVLERPSSAVKEMIENSIDAGARSITVEVAEGGRDSIRIVDDGCGIHRDQLLLAVTSHATSKLDSEEDLFRIQTLGFRGEALSSIAGVSDFRLQSRPADAAVGAALTVSHGEVGEIVDCGCPPGTQIEVRNLFASVPVRRKFLKSKQTELGHISEAMTRLALAYPAVALELIHNGRTVLKRPADLPLPDSIGHLFGQEIQKGLIPVESAADGFRVWGFVADPAIHRPNSTMQYLFVNGRFIRDRSLSHAVTEAYRGLVMTGRYPVSFLFLEIPNDQVDVNVHPTKIEVRFQDSHRLYSQILSTIRTRFLASDLTAKFQLRAEAKAQAERAPAPSSGPSRAALNERFALTSPQSPPQPSLLPEELPARPPAPQNAPTVARSNSWAEGKTPGFTFPSPKPSPFSQASNGTQSHEEHSRPAAGTDSRDPAPEESGSTAAPSVTGRPAVTAAREPSPPVTATQPSGVRALQIHNTYLIVETEEGMLLVDQHALHERILYEEFRQRVQAGNVLAQELLVPEPVSLSPIEVGLILDHREVLEKLGMRVEEFGDRCVLVQSYPSILRKFRAERMLRAIAHHLQETGKAPSQDQLLEGLLEMMACKAAVKAGDPLTPEEIDHLLSLRHLVDDAHHCPHGRPTVLRFSLAELERQFGRI